MPVLSQGGSSEIFVTVWDSIWHPELKKTGVRQALAYATDCPEMIDSLYESFYECYGNSAPPDALGLTPENSAPFPYDPDQARELLEEAGYDESNEIVINVIAGGFFKNTELAEAQAQFFRNVGVNAQIQVFELANWLLVARTGCGNAVADLGKGSGKPPEDFCLGLPPGPPTFISPQGYQLNTSNQLLDFSRTATTFMNCEVSSSHVCDPANIQPPITPVLEASGADREQKMEELADIIHDEQFMYTYFVAEVFYGISEDPGMDPSIRPASEGQHNELQVGP